jgi:hypothetical protein
LKKVRMQVHRKSLKEEGGLISRIHQDELEDHANLEIV